jgi:hypothetical protein
MPPFEVERLNRRFEKLDEIVSQNVEENLPNQELLKMENLESSGLPADTVSLYEETYLVTSMGLASASMILQGVLMENLCHSIYFQSEGKRFKGSFKNLIEELEDDLKVKHIDFLQDLRKFERNTRVHSDWDDMRDKFTALKPIFDGMSEKEQREFGGIAWRQLDKAQFADSFRKCHELIEFSFAKFWDVEPQQ